MSSSRWATPFKMAVCKLLLLLSLSTGEWAFAQDELVLTARPGLCILKDAQTQQCVMGVELTWRGPTGDYCLYESGREYPLQCWQEQPAGEMVTRLASEQDVAYWLQEPASSEHLAEIVVRVLSLAQRRPERRRRRHAWAPL